VASGWADLGHHASLRHGEPLVPGRAYLLLGGTDGQLFDPALPRLGDTLTFDLARTSLAVGLTKPEH
jgi:X-Pro dipeptidyl-peptidase